MTSDYVSWQVTFYSQALVKMHECWECVYVAPGVAFTLQHTFHLEFLPLISPKGFSCLKHTGVAIIWDICRLQSTMFDFFWILKKKTFLKTVPTYEDNLEKHRRKGFSEINYLFNLLPTHLNGIHICFNFFSSSLFFFFVDLNQILHVLGSEGKIFNLILAS